MADYYPLIARAIAGLDPSAPGESRRALYERARSALIAQLRSVQPPLSESEITRERLSLEEAVRKVESEAAQRARDASRPGGGPSRGGDAFRRANARPPEPGAAPPTPSAPRARPAAPPPSRDDQRQPRNLRPDTPPPVPPPPQRARIGQGIGQAGDREPKKARRAGAVFPFKSAIAIGLVLILVGAGILWGKSAVTMVSGLFKSSPTVEAPKDTAAAPQSKPKIPDRVGQPSYSDQVAPVAQRVVRV